MSRFQCFIFFEKVKGIFKNGKSQLLKMAISGYRTSFQAPTLSQKHVRSVSDTA